MTRGRTWKLPRLWLIALVLVVILSATIATIVLPWANLPRRVSALGIAQTWVPAGYLKMGSDPNNDPSAQAQPDELPGSDRIFSAVIAP